jgi:hypothetical protein
MNTNLRLAVGLCAALTASSAAAATAGAFQFVSGDVRLLLAAGAERPARKGTPLATGDTIATARDGTAQIKMGDGAIIVVQPESRLTVVEFRYAGMEDGSEKVVYRLEQGGFRAITGAIGRSHKDNYLIQTPIAHMGVRGTDHESYYLPSGGPNGSPAGVYNKVNVGAVYIRTTAGEVVVHPSQTGYAASAKDTPRLLAEIPAFFNRATPPRPAQLNPGAVRVVGATVPVEQIVSTTGGLNLSDPSAPGVPGAPLPGMGSGSAVGYNQGNGGVGRAGIDLAIATNGATLTNAGSDTAFGVDWGTWRGDALTVEGKPTAGGAHFASSTQLTSAAQLAALPPALVSATYKYAGGPAPTDLTGAQGSISALTVGVNFSKQTIDNYAVTANVGGTTGPTWNATGNGTFAQFSSSSGINLKGTYSVCSTCSAPATGNASGAFVGPAAERMITSFGLKDAKVGISGAALLSR